MSKAGKMEGGHEGGQEVRRAVGRKSDEVPTYFSLIDYCFIHYDIINFHDYFLNHILFNVGTIFFFGSISKTNILPIFWT